jgi:hypothetical protein
VRLFVLALGLSLSFCLVTTAVPAGDPGAGSTGPVAVRLGPQARRSLTVAVARKPSVTPDALVRGGQSHFRAFAVPREPPAQAEVPATDTEPARPDTTPATSEPSPTAEPTVLRAPSPSPTPTTRRPAAVAPAPPANPTHQVAVAKPTVAVPPRPTATKPPSTASSASTHAPAGVTSPSVPGPSPQAPEGWPAGASPSLPAAAATVGSRNWSGYVASGSDFTGVSASWRVPAVPTSADADVVTWVGIGGSTTSDLIQAGTEVKVGPGKALRVDAWIERLPQLMVPVPLTVKFGDTLSVAILQSGATQWLVRLRNDTTGQAYQINETYASSRSSAEWIVETPSYGGALQPLARFGDVAFAHGAVIAAGQNRSIAQAKATPLDMTDAAGHVIATTSVLGGNGATFTVTRTG